MKNINTNEKIFILLILMTGIILTNYIILGSVLSKLNNLEQGLVTLYGIEMTADYQYNGFFPEAFYQKSSQVIVLTAVPEKSNKEVCLAFFHELGHAIDGTHNELKAMNYAKENSFRCDGL